MLHYFVIPIRKYHTYLSTEYVQNCPPDDMASGLVSLPLKNEYLSGRPTTQRLPVTGERLSGKNLYNKLLRKYTTLNVTAEEVYQEGMKQLNKYFPKVRKSLKSSWNGEHFVCSFRNNSEKRTPSCLFLFIFFY